MIMKMNHRREGDQHDAGNRHLNLMMKNRHGDADLHDVGNRLKINQLADRHVNQEEGHGSNGEKKDNTETN
jgi:transposase InsO family protein